jgi:hypothetical protein
MTCFYKFLANENRTGWGLGDTPHRRARPRAGMKLTRSQRQLFCMLANARRSSRRQGVIGPLLLVNEDRELAFRLAEIGEDEAQLLRWPAKKPRTLARLRSDLSSRARLSWW